MRYIYHTGIHTDNHNLASVYRHSDGTKVFTGTREECLEFRSLLEGAAD